MRNCHSSFTAAIQLTPIDPNDRIDKVRNFVNILDKNFQQMVINHLMHRKTTPILPSFATATEMVNTFSDFFKDKITKIRDDIHVSLQADPNTDPFVSDSEFHQLPLTTLTPATDTEVIEVINNSPPKTCTLDPIPTSMVKEHIDVLIEPITAIINSSLTSGHFPDWPPPRLLYKETIT